ncbi:MAG: di-trans,poly-cis-decaprenylcistransferase [Methanosarcinaceae archaeon]|nr:di-trans,poly-cis-decaprenylcistransferase [Methanosarcinaceae archaeon]
MLNIILNIFYKGYEQLLIREIQNGPVPEHVAIIMDGNRRYAKMTGKLTSYGHRKGADITEKVIEWSYEIGLKELTIYAFSTENFNRSDEEKNKLFDLIRLRFESMCEDNRTHERRLKVRVIGERTHLPDDLRQSISRIETATKNYDKFNLNVAIAYGGRQDLVQAVKEIANKVVNDELLPDDINESTISEHLYPSEGCAVPNVDLIIRTGGNERVSNFLPWQASGNECAAYFCAPFWPDFRKIDLLRSIRVYQRRIAEQKMKNNYRTTRFLKEIEKTESENITNGT